MAAASVFSVATVIASADALATAVVSGIRFAWSRNRSGDRFWAPGFRLRFGHLNRSFDHSSTESRQIGRHRLPTGHEISF